MPEAWLEDRAVLQQRMSQDVLMGDLVLLPEEVNPAMSALLDHDFDVTAVHNHFFFEQPRIFFMHVIRHLIGKNAKLGAATSSASKPQFDPAKIARIVGHQGEQTGPVYKITIGRDDITLNEMGATINARMGLNTWAAFYGTDQNAEVAGDVAMLANEVTPVLKALRSNHLNVVAVHNDMVGTNPTIYFLHYWGRGPAERLAAGFKAALDQLGKK